MATLTAASHAEPLRVLSFRGREAVSRPFRFKVVVAVAEADVPDLDSQLVGERALLAVEVPDGEVRSIWGIVARITTGQGLDHRMRAVELVLVPRLSRLAHRVTSRIFQNLTTPQIVAAVLDEAIVPHRSTLVTTYEPRGYCVQHRESDHAFVTRLLAEEGIWYYFEHGDEDTVVLADSERRHPPIAGAPDLVLRERCADDAQRADEGAIFRFDVRHALAPSAVLHRDHDFRRPGFDRRASAQNCDGGLLVYEHGESEEEGLGLGVGPSSAGTRLAQIRRRAVAAEGRSACRRLAPGLRFNLTEHPLEADGSYAITRVTHEADAAELAGTEPRYEARFDCVPAQLGLRPKRPRRVLKQVTETARVVGPEGQDVYTDELGRVKVQFRWDLDGRLNEHSSCWLRVATPWAGAGYGFVMIPRVGMEVLVTFLDGDVDRPVVTGCLYNGANRPPFMLPATRTRSGLFTRTSPRGTHGNELSFEDASGWEQITMRGPRDILVSAGRDWNAMVARDHHLTVKGRASEEVRGDRAVEVGGMLRESAGGRSRRTRGDVAESIAGRSQRQIARSDLLTIGGDQVVHVSGSSDLVVGTPGKGNHHAVTVLGDEVLSATGTITLRASEKLILACGESTIELSPQGVKLTGKRIDVASGACVEIRSNGPVFTLDNDAQLAANTVRLVSPLARLVLDKDAKLDGVFVRLNSPDDPTLSTNGAPPPETQPFKLKLSDAEFGAWAGKHYQLHVDGLTLDGTTDAEGVVDQKIPKAATSVSLLVWVGDYPTGPTRKRTVHLKPLAPTNSARGAGERLSHLGYFSGEPQDKPDDALRTALTDFQGHVGLPVTGALDGATIAKLDALHGA